MLTELKSELEKRYAGQASKKYLENLAERLAHKVEKQEDIEGVLKELEDSPVKISDLQVEGDRRVSEIKKKFEEKPPKESPPDTTPEPSKQPTDELDAIKRELAEMRRDRERAKARAALMERTAGKNIPRALLDDVHVDSVDDVDTAIERLEKKSEALRKEWGVALAQDPPKKGEKPSGPTRAAVEDIMRIKPR